MFQCFLQMSPKCALTAAFLQFWASLFARIFEYCRTDTGWVSVEKYRYRYQEFQPIFTDTDTLAHLYMKAWLKKKSRLGTAFKIHFHSFLCGVYLIDQLKNQNYWSFDLKCLSWCEFHLKNIQLSYSESFRKALHFLL